MRVLQSYESIPISHEPDSISPTPREAVVYDPSSNPKYIDELHHKYKSLSKVHKGNLGSYAWDGADSKKEWLWKYQIIPAKYSEVEILNVTDKIRHRDFLTRRNKRDWRETLPIAQANDTSVELYVKYELTQCWKRLVSDEYKLIEREVLKEEEKTANADNCINAFIASLRQLAGAPSSSTIAKSIVHWVTVELTSPWECSSRNKEILQTWDSSYTCI